LFLITKLIEFHSVFSIKKAELPLLKGSPAIYSDPWLSVPALQQVWLCLALNIIILYKNIYEEIASSQGNTVVLTDSKGRFVKVIIPQCFYEEKFQRKVRM